MRILTALPSRGLSALWGKVNDVELPLWFRTQLFQLWTVRSLHCSLGSLMSM
jgi:phosphatidylserine decarboxylase